MSRSRICVPLCLLFTLVLTANAAAAITLEMWNSDARPATLTWYKDVLIPAFEKTHPGVTVNVTKTPWGDNLTSKIVTTFAAGVGPDIMYGGAEFVDDWVENGFVIPITERVKGWRDWSDILPPTLGAVTYNG